MAASWPLSEADVVHSTTQQTVSRRRQSLRVPTCPFKRFRTVSATIICPLDRLTRLSHPGYIDKAGIFTIIEIDRSTLTVRFRSVFEIPQVIRSSQRGSEYPVAICAAPDIWVISDGGGQLFVVRTPQTADQAELLAQHDYIVDNEPKPCRMHAACMRNESILIIVSSRGQVEKAASGRPSMTFHLATLRILIPDGPPMDTRSSL
ncbi:SubName: Full=Uncharacterized protein {ECO:0000313/EMBL:CCA72083.1} [Serendipita indica DSM 11827]|nr:SubName: Full=Uncharacterized protein {ECO:0000313/EMBL:CCA72083.1} [Serendipita indica DSM 11827]